MELKVRGESAGGNQERVKALEKALAEQRAESERLSRRNGELDGTARRLRDKLRALEGERDRTLARVHAAQANLQAEVDRSADSRSTLSTRLTALQARTHLLHLVMHPWRGSLPQQGRSGVHLCCLRGVSALLAPAHSRGSGGCVAGPPVLQDMVGYCLGVVPATCLCRVHVTMLSPAEGGRRGAAAGKASSGGGKGAEGRS